MHRNVKGKKRDQLRRERYNAIAKRDQVVAGEPLKQHYPCFGQGKNVSIKSDQLKHGERRRVNVALSNARYDDNVVILDDRKTAAARLFATAHTFVV